LSSMEYKYFMDNITRYQIIQTPEFSKWLNKLKDRQSKERIIVRLLRIKVGNFGDVKPVGDGVSEARIDSGAGYRLYFIRRGDMVVIMLGGGDKSSQDRDIKNAKELAKEWA